MATDGTDGGASPLAGLDSEQLKSQLHETLLEVLRENSLLLTTAPTSAGKSADRNSRMWCLSGESKNPTFYHEWGRASVCLPLCVQCEFCLPVDGRPDDGRRSTVDVVQVARAAGLPRATLQVYICTTPRPRACHDMERHSTATALRARVMDISQQRLQARCQRKRDQRRNRSAADTERRGSSLSETSGG